ncbi:MAG: PD40 domain-containing protein [Acidobacteria bacterium]|nr:PD40 domain-containing protein [Acidobacteriota bacterium]
MTELNLGRFQLHPRFSPDGSRIAFLKRPNFASPIGDLFG